MNTTEELEHLFSYGTLQTEAVQLATFGRKLVGEPDTLLGYRQTMIALPTPIESKPLSLPRNYCFRLDDDQRCRADAEY